MAPRKKRVTKDDDGDEPIVDKAKDGKVKDMKKTIGKKKVAIPKPGEVYWVKYKKQVVWPILVRRCDKKRHRVWWVYLPVKLPFDKASREQPTFSCHVSKLESYSEKVQEYYYLQEKHNYYLDLALAVDQANEIQTGRLDPFTDEMPTTSHQTSDEDASAKSRHSFLNFSAVRKHEKIEQDILLETIKSAECLKHLTMICNGSTDCKRHNKWTELLKQQQLSSNSDLINLDVSEASQAHPLNNRFEEVYEAVNVAYTSDSKIGDLYKKAYLAAVLVPEAVKFALIKERKCTEQEAETILLSASSPDAGNNSGLEAESADEWSPSRIRLSDDDSDGEFEENGHEKGSATATTNAENGEKPTEGDNPLNLLAVAALKVNSSSKPD